MGRIDKFLKSGLVEREDGRFVFYPWGILGHGRVIDSAMYLRLKRVSLWNMGACTAILFSSILLSLWAMPLFLIPMGMYAYWVSTAFKDCELAKEPLDFIEIRKKHARALGKGGNISLILLALLLLSTMIWMVPPTIDGLSALDLALLLPLLFLTIGIVQLMYVIKLEREAKQQPLEKRDS